MKRKIFGLFIILLTIRWGFGSMYGDIPRKENAALLALFNDTGGSTWNNKGNWKNAPGTEHTWYGITCDANNTTILELKLPNNNLQGKLPADLGSLSNLTILDLGNNRLSGSIPSWIKELKNLKKLDLSRNQFTDPIPTWIGELENLEELVLDNNLLKGPIPASLGNLSKLKILKLGSNGLIGEFPAALAKLNQLLNNNSDFKWNGLYTTNSNLANFLKQKQSGNNWESTQTIAPEGITVVSQTETSITLSWIPIMYKQDRGGYRVFYRMPPDGPYQAVGVTADKSTVRIEINGLAKSTDYYFVLQTWTDPHSMNRNKIESRYSEEFRTATRGVIISGVVSKYIDETKSQMEALQGVRIEASNNGGTTETDKDGKYILSVTPRWTGTLKPSLHGYKFSPNELEYKPIETNIRSQDFTATVNTIIKGKVVYNFEGIADVELVFESSQRTSFIAKTDSGGNYISIVPYNWSGIVTPKKAGHQFKPRQKVYGGVISLLDGEDYTVEFPVISGRVTNQGGKTGIPGVTLAFSNIETNKFKYLKEYTTTDSEGNYLNQIPDQWTGDVWPTKKGYLFYPSSRNNISIDNMKSTVNFKGERDFKLFFLVSGNYLLPSESRFRDIYGSGPIYPSITVGYKFNPYLYIYGGYSYFSKNGKSLVLEKPSKWKQSYLALGVGYYKNISIRFAWRASIGAMIVRFSEEAFGDKVTANAMGVWLEANGIYKIGQCLFTEISLAYLYAPDTVEEIPIELGGIKIGIGLGFRF